METVQRQHLEDKQSKLDLALDEICTQMRIQNTDNLVAMYQAEVAELVQESMSNDRVRYYMQNLSAEMYRLMALKSRQGMSRDVALAYHEFRVAEEIVQAVPEQGKKYTREDKAAIARINTQAEEELSALFKAVDETVDQRVRGIQRILRTLDSISMMNMSEAKLSGN